MVFRAPAEVQPKLPKAYPAKCLGGGCAGASRPPTPPARAEGGGGRRAGGGRGERTFLTFQTSMFWSSSLRSLPPIAAPARPPRAAPPAPRAAAREEFLVRIFGLGILEFLVQPLWCLLFAVPDEGGLSDCLTPHRGRRRARTPASDSEEPRSIFHRAPPPPALAPRKGRPSRPSRRFRSCVKWRVNSGGECGAPRGRGGGRHGVRGSSGGVPARGPGVSPDLCPRARPSPPVFHPPETLQSSSVSASGAPPQRGPRPAAVEEGQGRAGTLRPAAGRPARPPACSTGPRCVPVPAAARRQGAGELTGGAPGTPGEARCGTRC